MHDVTNLESRGVPTVFVASSEFEAAAAAQASALGFSPAGIFVPHPIQDRSDNEMRALAENALPAIMLALIEGHGV